MFIQSLFDQSHYNMGIASYLGRSKQHPLGTLKWNSFQILQQHVLLMFKSNLIRQNKINILGMKPFETSVRNKMFEGESLTV